MVGSSNLTSGLARAERVPGLRLLRTEACLLAEQRARG